MILSLASIVHTIQVYANVPSFYVYILQYASILIVLLILVDVNECSKNNGGCSHFCHNTLASYYCSCNGYEELDVDNRTCIGI